MNDCIFCKIIKKEISSNPVFEDDDVIAINDIHPKKPIHILVIPKKHLEDFADAGDEIIIPAKNALQKLVSQNDLMGKGYRIEVNGGGHQIINHLHFHLLAPMGAAPVS